MLEELTSPELAAADRAGKTTIIVPIGGTEQNGPAHGARQAQRARARVLAEKIARELGNALVAPVIAYVPEGEHQSADRPHAVSGHDHACRPTPTARVLEYAARSFRLHGFRDIVFLGDSGDYQNDNLAVATRARPGMGGDAGARARDRRVLPRAHRVVRASAASARASHDDEDRHRMPGSPTRR